MEEILLFRTLFAALLLKETSLNDQQFSNAGKSDKSIPDEEILHTKVFVADQEKVADSLMEYEELTMSLFEGTLCDDDYNVLRSFCTRPKEERDVEYARYAKPVIAAAKKGNIKAQYNLACFHLMGIGVPQDTQEALKLLHRSALRGNLDAQVLCGEIYGAGSYGVIQNPVESLRWYRMAAEQGEPRPQIKLAVRYYHGDGVPQDLNYAFAWATIALSNRKTDEEQKRILGSIIKEIRDTLTPTEHKRIRKVIRELSSEIKNMETPTEDQ